jgi:hypothetical protein
MLRRLRVACVVALALGGTFTATLSTAATATASYSAPRPQPDPAATSLATDRNITLAEAEERLRWQRHTGDLEARLRASLGAARFGGLWIDPNDGDRLKVGIVGAANTDHTTVATAATAEGVAASVDMVGVRYSEARLAVAYDWISERLVSVNKKAPWPIELAHSVRGNRLRLELPRQGRLTSRQQALIGEVRSRYGDLLRTAKYDRRLVLNACVFAYCEPPLRANIVVHSPSGENWSCTGGFLGRSQSDNKLYMFFVGHCAWAYGTGIWWTRFYLNGARHDLGPVHNGYWGPSGDMAIIRITNEAGWRPRAWVRVTASPDTTQDFEYSITGDGHRSEGKRICKAGASGGTDCGMVTDLGVTKTGCIESVTGAIRCETMSGLGRASYCSTGGDSGAPVFADHTAFGLHVGSAGTCDSVYQGINGAENLMRVNVAHDAG